MTREAFLRFESVPLGEKYSVTLTVKETSAKLEPESQVVVCQAGGGWSESNITWSTAPDFAALNSSSCIVSEADLSVGGSVCFDVPADFVDGDGQLNLAVQLVDSGAEWVSFHSRDAPKSHAHPRLHFTEQVSELDAREEILDGSVMIYKVDQPLYYNATGRIGDQCPPTTML